MAAWLFGPKAAARVEARVLDSNGNGGGMGPSAAAASAPPSLHRRRPVADSHPGRSERPTGQSIQRLGPWKWVAAASLVALGLVLLYPNHALPFDELSMAAAADDPCRDQWTEERLVGKCFGLEPYPEATSAEACRQYCCEQGDACVTWQFQAGAKGRGCMAGGPVRLGLELAATPNWCEPTPPSPWRGNRLSQRAADGQCTWGEALPNQCFGLGPERVRQGTKGEEGRLTEDECRARCCKDADCGVWQWREDKGCFTNKKEGHCETDELPYVGGRKRQDASKA